MTENSIDVCDTSLLWSHSDDCERVYPLNEAITMYVEQCEDNDERPSDVVQMRAFRTKIFDADFLADCAIDTVLTQFDENYGHPEESSEATPEMKKAALDFVRAITAEYRVWQAEHIGSIYINLKDMVQVPAPESDQ